MKRRTTPRGSASTAQVPDELLAGACVEVWSPNGDWIEAMANWRDARNAWTDEQGIGYYDHEAKPRGLMGGGHPWSWERSTPEQRAEMLESCGLPPDWTPTMVGEDRPFFRPNHGVL